MLTIIFVRLSNAFSRKVQQWGDISFRHIRLRALFTRPFCSVSRELPGGRGSFKQCYEHNHIFEQCHPQISFPTNIINMSDKVLFFEM